MKRVFFALATLAVSALLILAFLSRDRGGPGTVTATVDLSDVSRRFRWDESKKAFAADADTSLARGVTRGIYYEKITPVDGIYYRAVSRAASKPVKFTQKGDTVTIELKHGVFVCDLQSSILRYEIRMDGLVLRPTGRGVFIVDLTQPEPTVYSYNSFLKADLLDVDGSISTQFTLFPSLLFRYDPSNTSELKKADLIRVATIDTIRFVDIDRKEGIQAVFGSENTDGTEFFSIATGDMNARIAAFNALYRSAIETDVGRLRERTTIDPSNPLFINATKKEVVLKNLLLEKILTVMQETGPANRASDISALGTLLSDMEHENPALRDDGVSIVKRYLYLSTFSAFLSSEKTAIITRKESPYLGVARDVLRPGLPQEASYQGIASIFSHYYFNKLKADDFNAYFREYLGNLVQGKTIEKSDFLYFSFFITQYLASGPFPPDENTLQIMFSLFAVTDEYYGMVTNDQNATTILSTIFYSYNQWFSRLIRVFTDTFFDASSPKGLVMRPEYLAGDTPNLPQSFLDLFKDLTNTLANDLDRKRTRFYAGQTVASGSNVQDNYTILAKTYGQLNTMRSIFLNYPEYAKALELNDRNRAAKWVLFQTSPMSIDAAREYLSSFNDVDISTLKIDNDFKQDGYYDVRVSIAGNAFSFYLYPDGHTISNIAFTDTTSKKHLFANIVVGLDQKKEQMQASMGSTDDPKVRYRRDFKNYFKTAFIESSDAGDGSVTPTPPLPPQQSDRPQMDPAMQLFVQNELIEKDFKNIVSTLRIDFSNIYATIRNGVYSIDLSNIKYTSVGNGDSFQTEISGKYTFDSHSFYRLSLRVRRSDGTDYDLNGATVTILPSRIPLQNIEAYLHDLGLYLTTIRSNLWSATAAEIDFTAKKVTIDGREFTPNFTSLK